MIEDEARRLLRDCGGFGGLEAWIAEQPWQAAPGGWSVAGRVRGRSLPVEAVRQRPPHHCHCAKWWDTRGLGGLDRDG